MPTFIDFFAGAGGLSEGFIKAGYVPIAHVEMKKDACDTLRTRAAYHYLREHNQLDIYENYLRNKREGTDGSELWRQVPAEVTNRVIQATIGDKTMRPLKQQLDKLTDGRPVDIIIGGPPCQAYSIAGRARLGESVKEDPRNYLYKYYLRFIRHFKPKMFVFENVVGIKTAKTSDDIRPFEDLRRLAWRFGYDIGFSEQVASDYEVLQHRHRMIIVGWRRLDANKQPTGFHYPELQKIPNPYHTRESIFADLPVRFSNDGRLCEIVHYTKPLEEMQYLRETSIRGTFDFTTQHVTRKQNISDREVYCLAVQALQKGIRLNYNQLPDRLKTHKNRKSFLNRFFVSILMTAAIRLLPT